MTYRLNHKPVHFSSLIPKMLMFHSCHILFDHFQFAWFMDLTFQVPMQYCSLQYQTCFYYQSHPPPGVVISLAPSLHSFWSYFSTDLKYHIGHLLTWEINLSVSYLSAFSYCSWDSQGKNTEEVCHSLLQWTTFCQTSPPWPICFGWPHMAWLSFTELDKTVVCEIRLASCLWLWF